MPDESKLRGNAKRRSSPYPLGEIPHTVAVAIGKQIVHRLAVGNADITGDDFGVIFASAVGGDHKGSPLGVADVSWNSCAWSVKTVKADQPFIQTRVRLISGRNSPVYSSGVMNPFDDIQATGKAVLDVWNGRVNGSLHEYDDLRIFVMIRNMVSLEFTLMEHEATRFITKEFTWTKNKNGNLLGHELRTGEHCFTWQPHGSQFTVIRHVPASSHCFRIMHKPGLIEARHVLNLVRFEDDWIQEVPRPPLVADEQDEDDDAA